jgi:threonylcarbamoyladenosine tRNA methylthiotransferase MtaB
LFYSVISLGCKVNQSEGEDIAADLAAAGLEPAKRGQAADIIVINTCTVTGEADRKSRKAIHRAVDQQAILAAAGGAAQEAAQGAVVAVTGCYAALAADELRKIDGVALVVEQKDKALVAKKILTSINISNNTVAAAKNTAASSNATSKNSSPSSSPREAEKPFLRARAFLKVQDGCDNRCAYCIVPDARGNPASLPEEKILAKAEVLAASGAREIVITGINVGKYGKDPENKDPENNDPDKKDPKRERTSLIDVIDKVSRVPGVARVRLSSVEPEDVSLDLLGLITEGRLCPHLHIPLQSGCDATLKRMGRRYTTGEYKRMIQSVRAACPDAAITTDVIVGFPGETDEEFARTVKVIEQIRPARMHVFKYSRRPGTPAATMEGQISAELKAVRSETVRSLGAEIAEDYKRSQEGRQAEIVVERVVNGVAFGTTETYIAVEIPAAGLKPGDIVKTTL